MLIIRAPRGKLRFEPDGWEVRVGIDLRKA